MFGLSVHKGGTDVVSTRPVALLNYLAIYRREHPRADENMRLTVVGFPPGTAVRQMQRMVLFVSSGLVAFAILDFYAALTVAIAGSLLVGWLLSGLGWKIVRSARSAPPIGPIAVLLSDQRFTLLQSVPGEDPVVKQDAPPSAVTWGTLEPVASRWLRGQKVWTVLLGGPDGLLCTIEMSQADPVALQTVLDEAGLPSSHTDSGAIPPS